MNKKLGIIYWLGIEKVWLVYLVKWIEVEKEAVKRRTSALKIIDIAIRYRSLQAFWNSCFQSLHLLLLNTNNLSSSASVFFLSLSSHISNAVVWKHILSLTLPTRLQWFLLAQTTFK